MERGSPDERRVLIAAPTGQDAQLISQALAKAGMHSTICGGGPGLIDGLRQGAGLLLVTEEALSDRSTAPLTQVLEQQEPWSDLPVIVLTDGENGSSAGPAVMALSPVGNIILLERPLRIITLMHAARSALRARNRQYHVRDLLREREQEKRELAGKVRELAHSNGELEQFAYIAAHDLQEPNRMVISYLQLLERELRTSFTVRARAYFDHVMANSQRMGAMVRAVLEYSRIGKDDAGFTDVDTAMAVREATEHLAAAIQGSGAVIEVGPLPAVRGSKPQVVRLFQNLLSNAIKFRSTAPPAVVIQASSDGRLCHFTVADNGIGIAPEEGGKLFSLFQRLHGRQQYPGTGIGLAACKKIVEQHHGRIWFESTAGGGTTFHVVLQAAS